MNLKKLRERYNIYEKKELARRKEKRELSKAIRKSKLKSSFSKTKSKLKLKLKNRKFSGKRYLKAINKGLILPHY